MERIEAKQGTQAGRPCITSLKTGDLVFVAGKVRQVLNDHLRVGVIDLAYIGGELLPGGQLREFGAAPSVYTVQVERISLSALEAAGAVEVDAQKIVEALRLKG